MRMIARPGRGQLGDDPVDLDLGADVDAAGRLVEDQEPRLRRQPLRQHDLLLVAARQGADQLLDAGHPHVELLGVLVGDRALRLRVTRNRGNSRGRIGRVTFWAIGKSRTSPSWWRSSGR